MAQRARTNGQRTVFPRARTFGPAALTARQRMGWLWSRESLLRLILSFVLAFALWLYVSNKQDPGLAQDFAQPLTIQAPNVPDGLAIENDYVGVVYVRYKRLDPHTPVMQNSFHPFVDLIGLGPGRHKVKVQVLADPGIQILDRRPGFVTVYLERTQSRRVPVHAAVISRPPTGYGWTISPQQERVTVTGPDAVVSQVARATYDVELSGIRSTTSGLYLLQAENAQGGLITGHVQIHPPQIHVKISVKPWSSYKTLPVLVSISGVPKSGYGVVAATADPPEITASGSPQRLRSISTVHTAPVSVNKRGAGTFVAHVRLLLPRGVTAHTTTVTVRTQLAPVEASSSIEVGVVPSGVTSGLVVQHTTPARVLAAVVGPSDKLRGVAARVHATVDVTGYSAGTYAIAPSVTVPKGFQVVGVYPSKVTVILTAAP